MADNRQCAGLAILDANGELRFSAGVGADAAMAALYTDSKWRAEAVERRLLSVDAEDGAYLVVCIPAGDVLALVFSRAPGDAVVEFVGAVDFAYDIINQLINDPFDAMTVVDADARMAFISPIHESFFGLKRGEAIGQPVRDVIENTRLDRVVRTGKAEIGEVQRMRRGNRVVTRTPIVRDGKTVGAIGRVMFKGPKEVEALNRRISDLEAEVAFYRREADSLKGRSFGIQDLVGDSEPMRKLKSDIVRVAPLDVPVLISGETGSGKELVAHALHELSPRRANAMVKVNAAALPATLVESELFGYAAGAFTGADRKGRTGKFEQAHEGSLLLDEIGDMPFDVQSKLLRVLQDGVLDRVGGGKPKEVDFRLISATNQDLPALIEDDRFRLDLYYRISPVVLAVPPLRDRREDIPKLAEFFLDDFCHRHGIPAPRLESAVGDFLQTLSWPGNVRQLRNEIERAAIFAREPELSVSDFGHVEAAQQPSSEREPGQKKQVASASPSPMLKNAIERTERELIIDAMKRCNGNKKQAAAELGISRSHLYKKLEALDLDISF